MRSSETNLPSGTVQPAAQARRTSPYAAAWAVLGLFVLLALVLTWPLAAHLSTRLPGTETWAFDESTFVWNIWYFKHALLDLHTSPLHSELIWFPLGIDLILYTYNFFNALIGMPLQLAASPVVASNVTVLLATFLSALGAYLLALDTLRRVRPHAALAQLRAGGGHCRRHLRLRLQPRHLRCARPLRYGHHPVAPVLRALFLRTLRQPRPRTPSLPGCSSRWPPTRR
jgi:hypothetical protein